MKRGSFLDHAQIFVCFSGQYVSFTVQFTMHVHALISPPDVESKITFFFALSLLSETNFSLPT